MGASGGLLCEFHFLYALTAVECEIIGGKIFFEPPPAGGIHCEIQ